MDYQDARWRARAHLVFSRHVTARTDRMQQLPGWRPDWHRYLDASCVLSTAQITVTLSARLAWWAIPAAYVVAFAYRPFVGSKLRVILVESGARFASCAEAELWLREGGFLTAGHQKISNACLGKKKSAYGLTWHYEDEPAKEPIQPEYRSGENSHRSRPVICVETGKRFAACLAAVRWLRGNGKPNASSGNLTEACAGRRMRAYGYTWRYAD